MLTEREKHGIAELLHRLDASDLTSLAQTVTSRLIVPESTSEAVSAIVLHTEKASDLLKRRKLRKDFLFKYLHAKRAEGVDPGADKAVIVSHVLALWGTHEAVAPPLADGFHGNSNGPLLGDEDSCSVPDAPAPSRNASYSSLCNLDLHAPLAAHGLQAALHSYNLPPNLGLILNRTYSDPYAKEGQGCSNSLRRTDSNLSMQTDDSNSDFASAVPNFASNHVAPGYATEVAVITSNITSSQAQDLASTFVKWFYEMINSFNGSATATAEFRPDHFFSDADAKISLQPSAGDPNSHPEYISVSNSGREVHSVLRDIGRKYGLTYNPNLCKEGVRGIIDPHGLVLVTACGTLHNASSVCGTFHQQFGLVRDPFDGNNWKIKFTNASLVSKTVVSEIPRLDEATSFGHLQLEQAQPHSAAAGGASGSQGAMALS